MAVGCLLHASASCFLRCCQDVAVSYRPYACTLMLAGEARLLMVFWVHVLVRQLPEVHMGRQRMRLPVAALRRQYH
jgi:hypothetical protein